MQPAQEQLRPFKQVGFHAPDYKRWSQTCAIGADGHAPKIARSPCLFVLSDRTEFAGIDRVAKHQWLDLHPLRIRNLRISHGVKHGLVVR